MRFPLCITTEEGRQLVRTILSIDETQQSMIFAGDIPTGARVRFMRASYEDLVNGAAQAAEESLRGNGGIQGGSNSGSSRTSKPPSEARCESMERIASRRIFLGRRCL